MYDQQQYFSPEPTLEDWQYYVESRLESAMHWVAGWFCDLLFYDKIEFPKTVEQLRRLLDGTPELEEDFNEVAKLEFAQVITLQDVAVFLHRYMDAEFAKLGDDLRDSGDKEAARRYQVVHGMMPK